MTLLRYGVAAAKRKLRIAATVAGIVTAAHGLAGDARAQDAGRLVIVALGDSLTQGYGLPPPQGFVPVLQGWLDARGANTTIVNAGVSGDTTAGGLARLDWSLSGGEDGLIVALGGNDLLRGLPPAAARKNLDAIMSRAEAQGVKLLLIGLSAPGNYGADYKTAFDGMWEDLARRHDALLLRDFLAPLTAMGPDALVAEGLVQNDRLHPSAKGVSVIVDHVGPAVLELIAAIRG